MYKCFFLKMLPLVALAMWGRASEVQTTQPAQVPPTTQATGGTLELDSTVFDFKEVWQNAPAEKEFTAKNVGTGPLTLELITTCGCTPVTKPKSPLLPGESTTFKIMYGTSRPANANKSVTLRTNDPQKPQVEIAVRGTVKPLFTATPTDIVMFQSLDLDSDASQKIRLENNYGSPVTLKLLENQEFGRFRIDLTEVEAGKTYELHIATRPPLELGYNRSTVVLTTGLKEVPQVPISVAAHAQPRVMVMPSFVNVLSTAMAPTQHVVRVQHRGGDLQILDVRCPIEGFAYEIVPKEPAAANSTTGFQQIRVTLPPFAQIPVEPPTIEIRTNDPKPQYQKLEVPIRRRQIPNVTVQPATAPAVLKSNE